MDEYRGLDTEHIYMSVETYGVCIGAVTHMFGAVIRTVGV